MSLPQITLCISTDLNIVISLAYQKRFRLAGDVTITFHSGRPDTMVLEKSDDFGVTWSPLQYYARDCRQFEDLVGDAEISRETPDAVVCNSR